MPAETITGVILAGGQSRRMGGGDKALRLLAGRPMLAHVIARAGPQISELALNANGDAGRFAGFGLPVIADSVAGFAGPLAGILAGLDWAAALPGCVHLLSLPADAPFLPGDLLARLAAARRAAGADIAVAASGGRTHPVVALWPLALREDLRAALLAGERKIDRFTAARRVTLVEWPAVPLDPFFNANTPAELAEAERLLAG
ncbi:MAG: molybdenum cofactor guanylyltransferase MobA [Alphaproteobacteria bacterium]|nr:molybdenum cofactor guanylyltransferase MobA [Alphaproteobacteria bacterium]